jgi:hypothetical protein
MGMIVDLENTNLVIIVTPVALGHQMLTISIKEAVIGSAILDIQKIMAIASMIRRVVISGNISQVILATIVLPSHLVLSILIMERVTGAVKVDIIAMVIHVSVIIKTVILDNMLLVTHVSHVSLPLRTVITQLLDHVVGHVMQIIILLVANVYPILKTAALDNIS